MTQEPTKTTHCYPRITLWIKEYGNRGGEDQRAANDFVEIESHEAISSLRAELYGVSQGRYEDSLLDKTVGQGRRVRHGSYAEWAKIMLRWMARPVS